MLEIERMPSYLSPSSLMASEKQPNTFYMERLINDRLPREPQSLAAGIGSAFDYYVKMDLLKKFPEKEKYREELKGSVENNDITVFNKAHQIGKLAFNYYEMGAYDISELCDIEVHTTRIVNGVPVLGKLDATSFDKDFVWDKGIPFDWKVSGYTSKSGVSPKAKYFQIWSDEKPGMGHKDYIHDVSFEEIDRSWATQLATYGWLLGIPIGEPFPARIDMLCWNKKKKMRTAKYRGIITRDFQLELVGRYTRLWSSLRDGSFIDRLESQKDDEFVWAKSLEESWF